MQSIDKLWDHLNKKVYNNELIKTNHVKSIHCIEWGHHFKYLEKINYLRHLQNRIDAFRIIDTTERIHFEYPHKETKFEGHIDFRVIDDEVTISDAFLPVPNEIGTNNPHDKLSSTSELKIKRKDIWITCQKRYLSDDPKNCGILTVPYTQPDGITSLCSPVTMWIMLRVLCKSFNKEYVSLQEIVSNLPECNESIQNNKNGNDNGVSINQYFPFLTLKNFDALLYQGKRNSELYREKCPSNFSGNCRLKEEHNKRFCGPIMDWETAYAYVESEFPVYGVFETEELLSDSKKNQQCHTVAIIGHTMFENEVNGFIYHDVSGLPFSFMSKERFQSKLIESLVVVPKEIVVRYEDALKSMKIIKDKLMLGEDSEKLFYRAILLQSQKIKYWFSHHTEDTKISAMYSECVLPKYSWMFELRKSDQKENMTFAQILIDATSYMKFNNGEYLPAHVLINHPNERRWNKNGKTILEGDGKSISSGRYERYTD